MRVVLADAAAFLEYLHRRRADRRLARRVLDALVKLVRELLGADEDRFVRAEAVHGIVGERLLETHVRRFVTEARGLELIARRPCAAIGERIAKLLPRRRRRGMHRRPR